MITRRSRTRSSRKECDYKTVKDEAVAERACHDKTIKDEAITERACHYRTIKNEAVKQRACHYRTIKDEAVPPARPLVGTPEGGTPPVAICLAV